MKYRLCVIHSFDPLGVKVGGLETFVRDMIGHLPDDFSFLMIGVDASGQRELGKLTTGTFAGKTFDFLPILHYPEDKAREAARWIKDSINFHFMQALLRHLPAVRRALKAAPVSVDLQRVEFAAIVKGLGVPFVQMLHGEGAPKLEMDSLLKSYRYVHNINEWLAVKACDRFCCVNPIITERIRATYPASARKIMTQTTWVDTARFHASPFPPHDTFRVAFAGRLDLFKVPSLMFKTMARLADKLEPLGCRAEFHYMGTSDPHRFAEFKDVETKSVLHGFKSAAGVAEVLSNCHAGILTSQFEGMPFSVLETLGSGRPVCAIHLPQLASVIKDGVSGMLVARSDNSEDMAERLSDAFVSVRAAMIEGLITPEAVAAEVGEFTPQRQLAKIYQTHRDLQRRRYGDVFPAFAGKQSLPDRKSEGGQSLNAAAHS
jgi:glycosyltransferase involved in cell wall biosynthesis